MNKDELIAKLQETGISMRTLARALDVNVSTVSRWIDGKTKILRKHQIMLDSFFNSGSCFEYRLNNAYLSAPQKVQKAVRILLDIDSNT